MVERERRATSDLKQRFLAAATLTESFGGRRRVQATMNSRIMYILPGGGLTLGPGRIGRVEFSRSGRTLYYGGRSFQSLTGQGYKANYFDTESGEHYWISGCRRDGKDPLYPDVVEIDDDVRVEYWTEIRRQPENVELRSFRARGKHVQSGTVNDKGVDRPQRRAKS